MAQRYVIVNITVGEPEVGLWCDTCALPSKVEFPLYILTEHGVSLMNTVPWCMEHGRDD